MTIVRNLTLVHDLDDLQILWNFLLNLDSSSDYVTFNAWTHDISSNCLTFKVWSLNTMGSVLVKKTRILKTINNGGAGNWTPCLSHAKRALYHLSYTPFYRIKVSNVPVEVRNHFRLFLRITFRIFLDFCINLKPSMN